jgi:RNA-directed DNA polymerase
MVSCAGIPIGNLTSQIFANIYMNEFDQFMKHELKVRHYARYTDDFIVVSENREYLKNLIQPISTFLQTRLKLNLHPKKVQILNCNSGIDFLGIILFPYHRLIRKKTRKRMARKLKDKISQYKDGLVSEENLEQTFQSYLGVLSYANSYRLCRDIQNQYWFWLNE